jgi:MoaA/NifB/PqqE/SkfB family radical SAM enzyme
VGLRGLNLVGLSVEGPASTHDVIRDHEGGFDKTMRALRNLAEERSRAGKKAPYLHVTSVIQRDNIEALPEMPSLVAEAGADYYNLTLEVRTWDLEGLGTRDYREYGTDDVNFARIEPDRLAKALNDTRKAARDAGIQLRMPDMPDEQIVRYYRGQMDLSQFRCKSLWAFIIVAANGDAYPCWLKKVGSVREEPLRSIWNGTEMRAFRRDIRRGLPVPCAGCCFLYY